MPLLPLGQFLKRLKKNKEPSTRNIEIEKSDYEKQVLQLKD